MVSDQGPMTGIGTYAEELTKLVRPLFDEVNLVSLSARSNAEPPEHSNWTGNRFDAKGVSVAWERPPDSRFATSIFDVRRTISHNLKAFLKFAPRLSRVHFCGSFYKTIDSFQRPVVTLHDFYPRLSNTYAITKPHIIMRDLVSLWDFVTIPRELRKASSIVVPTNHVAQDLERRTGLTSVPIHHWIAPGFSAQISKSQARAMLGLPEDKTIILNVSSGTSNKNLPLLRRIASRLPMDFLMVKVGESIGVRGPVKYFEKLSPYDYSSLFLASDMYLHTSLEEGFGIPLIEAISSSLPVISLSVAVSHEVMGKSAIYVSRDAKIESWITAIEDMRTEAVRDRVLREYKSTMQHYLPSRALREYAHMYSNSFVDT